MSKRSDAIAAALRKAIEQGEYGDGERLSQSRLSLLIAKLNPRPGRRAQPRSTAQQGSAS